MANPYHDESGKFCSRGEMQGALKRLAAAGNVTAYFELQSDFDAIEEVKRNSQEKTIEALQKTIAHTKKTLRPTFTWGNQMETDYSAVIAEVDDTEALDVLSTQIDWNPYSAEAYLANPHSSTDLKRSALSWSNGLTADTFIRETDDIELVKSVANTEINGMTFLRSAIQNKNLSDEEAWDIARQSSVGTLAYSETDRVWDNDDEDFETRSYLAVTSSNLPRSAETYGLAAKTNSPRIINKLLEKGNNDYELAENSYIDNRQASALLSNNANSLRNYAEIRSLLSKNNALPEETKAKMARKSTFIEGKPSQELKDSLKSAKIVYSDSLRGSGRKGFWSATTEREMQRESKEKYIRLQAEYDSYESSNNTLVSGHARASQAFLDGTGTERAVQNAETRLENARIFRRLREDKIIGLVN